LILTTPALAGQEKVAFPLYQNHVLYTVLDQPDLKELREAYINSEARPEATGPRLLLDQCFNILRGDCYLAIQFPPLRQRNARAP
jgi:hypothetical protein